MKTILKTLALCALLATVAVACGKKENIDTVKPDDNNGDTTTTVTVAVTSVTLSQTTATLTVGDTLRLTATVAPDSATNKAVAWTSSSTAVATVSSGKVTAIAAGTANITVTTEDGSKTASCAVTVNAVPIPVTSVTLNQYSATLTVGDTLRLTATVAPDSATNKAVTWTSINTAIATVANGLVTAVAASNDNVASITVTTQDGSKTATCYIIVENPMVLGAVSFVTDSTWTVGSQTWSDAVQTSYCSSKTTYGTPFDNFCDCRSNPDYKGDLFSWSAVYRYKDLLCPNGWRVPTVQDFIDLDIALGGRGEGQYDIVLLNKYLTTWGGAYGGNSEADGSLGGQGSRAFYWSQSEESSYGGYFLFFWGEGYVYPQSVNSKSFGLSLRCVK